MATVIPWNKMPSCGKKLVTIISSIIHQHRLYHEVTGDIICPSMVQGIDHIRDPRLNKVCIVLLIHSNPNNLTLASQKF